jgi:hypothetical protein
LWVVPLITVSFTLLSVGLGKVWAVTCLKVMDSAQIAHIKKRMLRALIDVFILILI